MRSPDGKGYGNVRLASWVVLEQTIKILYYTNFLRKYYFRETSNKSVITLLTVGRTFANFLGCKSAGPLHNSERKWLVKVPDLMI